MLDANRIESVPAPRHTPQACDKHERAAESSCRRRLKIPRTKRQDLASGRIRGQIEVYNRYRHVDRLLQERSTAGTEAARYTCPAERCQDTAGSQAPQGEIRCKTRGGGGLTQIRYPHPATRQLEKLETLNGPRLHERIHDDVLVAGLGFHRDRAEDFQAGTELLGTLMQIYQDYGDEAGPFGDMFGEYLECNGQTSERNGQFFTPISVVDMMVAMTLSGQDLDGQPMRICDPAAGTGRFMLRTALHYGRENYGCLNFLFVNVDIDRRAFVYCTMNAVLNGISSICIHGDALRVEIWDAFATLPVGRFALWERVRPEVARDLIVMSQKVPEPPVQRETVQVKLSQGVPAHGS